MLVEDRADSLLKLLVLGGIFLGMMLIAACLEIVGPGSFNAPAEPQVASVEPMPQSSGLTPEAIMGKDASEVELLLGHPSLLREEEGAQIWQYARTVCVLMIYLYTDELGVYHVTYIEANGKGGGPSDVVGCLAAAPATQ